MTIRWLYEEETGILLTRWVGEVTLEEWQTHITQMVQSPAYKSAKYIIADTSRARANFFPPDVPQAAQLFQQPYAPNAKVAILASQIFQQAKELERIINKTTKMTVIVFFDIEIAITWLDLDGKKIKALFEKLEN